MRGLLRQLKWKIESKDVFCLPTEEYSPSIATQPANQRKNMKLSRLVIAALSVAAATVYADDADPSGQFAIAAPGTQTRAAVAQQLDQYRAVGVNPWSSTYNPLKTFRSERTRAEVRAEYIRNRAAVSALTGEDSGSAYLSTHQPVAPGATLAGQPANAQ
jgi:hypothetical protein